MQIRSNRSGGQVKFPGGNSTFLDFSTVKRSRKVKKSPSKSMYFAISTFLDIGGPSASAGAASANGFEMSQVKPLPEFAGGFW